MLPLATTSRINLPSMRAAAAACKQAGCEHEEERHSTALIIAPGFQLEFAAQSVNERLVKLCERLQETTRRSTEHARPHVQPHLNFLAQTAHESHQNTAAPTTFRPRVHDHTGRRRTGTWCDERASCSPHAASQEALELLGLIFQLHEVEWLQGPLDERAARLEPQLRADELEGMPELLQTDEIMGGAASELAEVMIVIFLERGMQRRGRVGDWTTQKGHVQLFV
jgi:hypothetical protein